MHTTAYVSFAALSNMKMKSHRELKQYCFGHIRSRGTVIKHNSVHLHSSCIQMHVFLQRYRVTYPGKCNPASLQGACFELHSFCLSARTKQRRAPRHTNPNNFSFQGLSNPRATFSGIWVFVPNPDLFSTCVITLSF